jgi:fructuronate reductase
VAGRLAPGLLAIGDVFGSDLPRHPGFTEAVTAALEQLYAVGAKRSVAELVTAAGG